MYAIAQFGLLIIVCVILAAGIGLATVPKAFAFIAGPGAGHPTSRTWTRYQGCGFMLLGAAFVMAAGASSRDLVPTVVMAMVACMMFALSVLRRQQIREARQ